MRGIRFTLFLLFIAIIAVSCQKDEALNGNGVPVGKTDSSLLTPGAGRGNILAVTGTLKITFGDSTYTFDAKTDSVAVVDIYLEGKKYFGITAINKAHTMSFGISSAGLADTTAANIVAGSQFLFSNKKETNAQYTLTQNVGIAEPGKINLTQYSKGGILAAGTFVTYLAKDIKTTAAYYKVEGSFSLNNK